MAIQGYNTFNQQGADSPKIYSQTELEAMQRDAVKRVNEMQRISKEKLSMQPPQFQPNASTPPPQQSMQQATQQHPQQSAQQQSAQQTGNAPSFFPPAFSPAFTPNIADTGGFMQNSAPHEGGFSLFGNDSQSGFLKGFIDKLNLDHETLILLGMLLLLVNEGADSMLILALVYILI